MATLKPRDRADGSTVYRVRWYDPSGGPNGGRSSMTFEDYDEAKRLKTLLDSCGGNLAKANEVMTKIKAREPSVAELAERHIKGLTGVSTRTREDNRRDVRNHIAPELGALPVSAVDVERVKAWVNARHDSGMAPKTLRNVHGLLSAIFSTAVAVKLREDNPCRGVRLPVVESEEMVFLDEREFAVLAAHLPEHYRLFVRFLVGTGLRWGEATALTPADVTFTQAGKARVRVAKAWKRLGDGSMGVGTPKTKRGRRSVPVPPSIVAEVRTLCVARPNDEPLFVTAGGTRMHHGNFAYRIWKPSVAKAAASIDDGGVEIPAEKRIEKHPRIHDLRHTYASWMLAAGIDVTKLSRLMGHESITTTVDRYGHVADEQYDDVGDAIDGALNFAAN